MQVELKRFYECGGRVIVFPDECAFNFAEKVLSPAFSVSWKFCSYTNFYFSLTEAGARVVGGTPGDVCACQGWGRGGWWACSCGNLLNLIGNLLNLIGVRCCIKGCVAGAVLGLRAKHHAPTRARAFIMVFVVRCSCVRWNQLQCRGADSLHKIQQLESTCLLCLGYAQSARLRLSSLWCIEPFTASTCILVLAV